jgi:hypothetical protein
MIRCRHRIQPVYQASKQDNVGHYPYPYDIRLFGPTCVFHRNNGQERSRNPQGYLNPLSRRCNRQPYALIQLGYLESINGVHPFASNLPLPIAETSMPNAQMPVGHLHHLRAALGVLFGIHYAICRPNRSKDDNALGLDQKDGPLFDYLLHMVWNDTSKNKEVIKADLHHPIAAKAEAKASDAHCSQAR